MALSNKFGWLVLTTGNKSEMAVGYSTLYGDSAGGFAVIKDCPKTLVYELARHRNAVAAGRSRSRSSTARRARSCARPARPGLVAPLRVLDPILDGYIEDDLGREALVLRGFDARDVDRVIALVDRAEYKRRQAPPGIKITDQGLRARPAGADHQPLRRLSAARALAAHAARPSRATGRTGARRRLTSPPPRPRSCGRGGAPAPAWIVPLDHRAQEARLVRQPHRGVAVAEHRQRGADGGEALRDRGVDAAVHEAGRLLDLSPTGTLPRISRPPTSVTSSPYSASKPWSCSNGSCGVHRRGTIPDRNVCVIGSRRSLR